jgi:hypothetical protein
MAIKKRSLPVAREADIEAFGNAALETDVPKSQVISPTSTPKQTTSHVSRQLLVRFPDEDMPRALEELATRDDRSKHYMALAALRIGIAQLQGSQ